MTMPSLSGIGIRQAVEEDVSTKLWTVETFAAAWTAASVCAMVPLMTFLGSGSSVRSEA